MKLGILLLAVGILLLLASIPYSILGIVNGINEAGQPGGFSAYLGLIGVIVGFVLITIGATRTFKK
jgi:hypothetical protein